MTPLSQMNSQRRANLLHQLLPDHIPALFAFMRFEFIQLYTRAEEVRKQFKTQLEFEDWCKGADEAIATINQKEKQLIRDSKAFADLLFTGRKMKWTKACLHSFASADICPDPLRYAINLLFDHLKISTQALLHEKQWLYRSCASHLFKKRDCLLHRGGVQSMVFDTSQMEIHLGVKETKLTGFKLTSIKLTNNEILLKVDDGKPYYPIHQLLPDILSIEDLLEILQAIERSNKEDQTKQR